ncbi:hypothetical protein EDB85DRAFT_1958849, partial [Lactarius pseudohatsudake]
MSRPLLMMLCSIYDLTRASLRSVHWLIPAWRSGYCTRPGPRGFIFGTSEQGYGYTTRPKRQVPSAGHSCSRISTRSSGSLRSLRRGQSESDHVRRVHSCSIRIHRAWDMGDGEMSL